MEEPMDKVVFDLVWNKLSEDRKKGVMKGVNELAQVRIDNGQFQPHTPYDFKLNMVFNESNPIQYVYVEGVLSGVPEQTQGGIMVRLTSQINYVEIGDDADTFLDRKSEIQNMSKENSIIHKIGYTDDEPNEKSQLDINSILNNSEALQKEMHQMIEDIKKTERGSKISYQDLQTIFYLYKISELQTELNQLKIKQVN